MHHCDEIILFAQDKMVDTLDRSERLSYEARSHRAKSIIKALQEEGKEGIPYTSKSPEAIQQSQLEIHEVFRDAIVIVQEKAAWIHGLVRRIESLCEVYEEVDISTLDLRSLRKLYGNLRASISTYTWQAQEIASFYRAFNRKLLSLARKWSALSGLENKEENIKKISAYYSKWIGRMWLVLERMKSLRTQTYRMIQDRKTGTG